MCLHTIFVEILMDKLKLARKTGLIAIGGGVSANSGWKAIKDAGTKYGWKTYVPKFEYTTDNAIVGCGLSKFYHNNLKLLLWFLKHEIKFKLCNIILYDRDETKRNFLFDKVEANIKKNIT
jgi:N6-L-threonylcarbamoyladenine synthase